MPRSLATNSAPVTMAISCSSDLRRSPKPGALMAHTLMMPRSLFTTSVASASPATSSAMRRRGRFTRVTCARRDGGSAKCPGGQRCGARMVGRARATGARQPPPPLGQRASARGSAHAYPRDHLLQNWDDVLHCLNLHIRDQHKRILVLDKHALAVGDKLQRARGRAGRGRGEEDGDDGAFACSLARAPASAASATTRHTTPLHPHRPPPRAHAHTCGEM